MMVSAYIAPNSGLVVEPSKVLKFPLISSSSQSNNINQLTSSFSTSSTSPRAFLTLTNLSRKKHTLFKIRTTRPEVYSVQPNQGVILPTSSIRVVVTFVTVTTEQLMQMSTFTRQQLQGQFLLQSYDRSEDESKPLDMEWFSEYWQRIPKELIVNKRLKCEFTTLPAHLTKFFSTIEGNYPPPQQVQHQSQLQQQQQQQQLPHFASQQRMFFKDSQVREQQPGSAISPLKNLAGSLVPVIKGSRSNGSRSTSSSRGDSVYSQEEEIEEEPTFCVQPNENHVQFVYATRQKTSLVSNFSLMNCSSHHAWAFKIKTTNVSGYSVKPSKGLLGGLGCQNIEVETHLVRDEDKKKLLDFEKRETQDKFLIEMMLIDRKAYKELKTLPSEQQKEQVTLLWNQMKKKSPSNRKTYIKTQMLDCKFVQEASIQVRHIPVKEIQHEHPEQLDHLVVAEEEYSANELDDSEVGSDDDELGDDESLFYDELEALSLENNPPLSRSKVGHAGRGQPLSETQQEYILTSEDTQRIARDTSKYFLI